MLYIGIDIGTTSTKALLFDEKGNVLGKSSHGYDILSPAPNKKEQDPDVLYQAVLAVLSELADKAKEARQTIEFISFSAVMHSLIAVDKEGKPLTNCMIWADGRSAEYANEFKKNGKGIELYKKTGTPCHPMSPLYKIMWLRDHEEEIFAKTEKFISIKEYVIFKLFGKYIVDYSIASATGLFNIHELHWEEEAIKAAGITADKLSEAVPTTYKLQGINEEVANEIGIDKNTWVVVGASDGCLANLGSNGIKVGSVVVTIGTSGAIRIVSDKPLIDHEGRTFCYLLTEDNYVAGGAINNGGMAYRWFRDNFGEKEMDKAKDQGKDPYYFINEMIRETEAGSNGLLFIPFLSGERAPYWNADLRGSFFGISDTHKKRHFARAVIEGISFAINDVFAILKEYAGKVDTIYVNGGFTKSKTWVQILCDVLGVPIIVSDNYESPCLGACMLGMLALKKVNDLSELSYLLEDGDHYAVSGNHPLYQKLFKIYQNVIAGSMENFMELARIQNRNENEME